MYEAGELDLAVVEQPFTRRVVKDARLEPDLLMTPAAQIQYLGMNQNLYEPFKDIRVREAICRAIDLEGLSRGLFHGTAAPLAGQITEGVAGYNPENRPVSYDPERARTILAEAGYPGGEGMPPLAISAPEPNRMELAFYANQLKTELGIAVAVAVVERGTYLAAMNAGQVAFFPWAWSAAYPDGLYFLRDVWYGPSTYNRSRWQNDAFDALIERAAETPDNERRYELYQVKKNAPRRLGHVPDGREDAGGAREALRERRHAGRFSFLAVREGEARVSSEELKRAWRTFETLDQTSRASSLPCAAAR